MSTGDTGTETNYFKPWISDEEPKVPEGWGLDAIRRNTTRFQCDQCKKRIEWQEQYLYQYHEEGTTILHNKKDCYEGFIH